MQVMLKWNDYLYYYERIICKFKHTLRAAVLIFSVFSLCHLHRAHSRCCWLTIAEFPFHQGEITCSKSWLKASRTHRKRNKQLDGVCAHLVRSFACSFAFDVLWLSKPHLVYRVMCSISLTELSLMDFPPSLIARDSRYEFCALLLFVRIFQLNHYDLFVCTLFLNIDFSWAKNAILINDDYCL